MLDFDLSFAAPATQSERIPFAGSLGVAGFDGQTPPERQVFEPVEGFDLSHAGISFKTPDWPATDRLMVALGDDRAPVLVSARVVACRRQADQDEPGRYEVRCEFERWYT